MLQPSQIIADVPTSAARVRATVKYNGYDITAEVAPYLRGLTYTDHAGEQADELTLSLADISDLWGWAWEPAEADTVEVSIICYDWEYPGQRLALPCGLFQIVTGTQVWADKSWQLSAISAALTAGGRRQRKYRAWEGATLRAIAGDVAAVSGSALLYEASVNPTLERVEQRYQTDFEFLRNLASESGLRLKVDPRRVILFDEATYEKRAPVFLVTPATASTDTTFSFNFAEAYRSCTLQYHDPQQGGSAYSATFTPPSPPPVGDVLAINERVDSQAAADALVRARLRAANRGALTVGFTMPYHPHVVGATVGTLSGFVGRRDGRYMVDRVTHSLGGNGSTSQIDAHRALEGY